MTRIFNKTTNQEILIDETNELVKISPKLYEEDNPHFDIELKGFNFNQHTLTCNECKSFKDSFGSNDLNWFIEFNNTPYRLDLSRFGKEHNISQNKTITSDYFSGTKLRLKIFINSKEDLERLLEEFVKKEEYEKCSILSRQIDSMKE